MKLVYPKGDELLPCIQYAYNNRESEVSQPDSSESISESAPNTVNCATQSENVQISRIERKELSELIKTINKAVKRHNLTYDNLRYIFRRVRNECDIKISRKRAKLPILPTNEEISLFLSSFKNQEHRLIFETLLNTGLRVSELAGIEVANIDWEKNTIFIKNGKGGKDRIVIFGDNLKKQLLSYLHGRNPRYLFETNRNWKFSNRAIQEICSKHRQMAEIEKELTPHTFRHIWNTKLAENGISREERAILAGHSSLQTQSIYTHLSVSSMRDRILKILDG